MSDNRATFVWTILQHQISVLLDSAETHSDYEAAKTWFAASGNGTSIPAEVTSWLLAIRHHLEDDAPADPGTVPAGTNAHAYLGQFDDIIGDHISEEMDDLWDDAKKAAHSYFSNRAPRVVVDWVFAAAPS